jgi:hypothetical protein
MGWPKAAVTAMSSSPPMGSLPFAASRRIVGGIEERSADDPGVSAKFGDNYAIDAHLHVVDSRAPTARDLTRFRNEAVAATTGSDERDAAMGATATSP